MCQRPASAAAARARSAAHPGAVLPDLAIWPLAEDGAPPPERPLLVIEVAVSRVSRVREDRLVMAPIYAAAGVPAYWIVNLVDAVIERHTEPQALPEVELAVADLLPRG